MYHKYVYWRTVEYLYDAVGDFSAHDAVVGPGGKCDVYGTHWELVTSAAVMCDKSSGQVMIINTWRRPDGERNIDGSWKW